MQVDEHATVAFLDLCVCAWYVYQLLIWGCVGLAPKMTHHQSSTQPHVHDTNPHATTNNHMKAPKKSNSIGCTIIKYYKPSIWWYLHLWNPPNVNICSNTPDLCWSKPEFPQDAGLHVERQLVGSDGMKQARGGRGILPGTEWKPI